MNADRRNQIEGCYRAVVDRPVADRAAFLAQACANDPDLRREVEYLLARGGEAGELLESPAWNHETSSETATFAPGLSANVDHAKEFPGVPATEKARRTVETALDGPRFPGRRIDRYEILRELGRGGMGSVYMAMRADDVHSNSVALKLVRPEAAGEDVVQRFRQEREILASLDHPNIARLLDGGTTPEGIPYFVMDYIDGQPIDRYCDERLLPVTERIRLFSAAAAAVEYAHQHGIIHRDLKPSNILVNGEGVVKLLDFGIAKFLRTEAAGATAFMTRSGIIPMTPEYASPEQVTGEAVGVATDLYSLGVILYELLTGHRPYRIRTRLIHEVMRVISEEEPTRPSAVVTTIEEWPVEKGRTTTITPQTVSRARNTTPAELRRCLAGDLDKVLLEAMRKEPAARYPSAAAFRKDLLRHLDGLPVLAQGRSWSYRAKKFLQRHRWWVLASLAVTAGIATGLIRISPAAAGIAGAFLLISIIGQYGLKANFGEKFASGRRFHATILGVTCVLVALLWFNLFLNGSQLAPFPPLLMCIYYLRMLLRWPFRDRWAGRMLVEATRPTPRLIFLFNTFSAAYLAFVAVFGWRVYWCVLVAGFPFVAYRFRIWGRIELREKGLLAHGHLVPWHKLRSYAWESTEPGVAMLRVQLVVRFQRSGHIWVPVSPQTKDAIAAVLDQHLSEWPGPT